MPLSRMKGRSLGEPSYRRPNLIKGTNAFKCLLFPQAKRLCPPPPSPPLSPMRSAQTPSSLDAINIERAPWPALPSYNNSVRTKVNALNLISVNGVVLQAEGGGDVGEGGRSGERLVVSGGAADRSKINYWSL